MAFIDELTNFLFFRQPADKLQGLTIWTDRSRARKDIMQLGIIPQNIQFVQKARISEQVVKDGRAFFFWRKDVNSDTLDLLELRLRGITRSLDPKDKGGSQTLVEAGREAVGQVVDIFRPNAQIAQGAQQATKKQQDWLKFWQLTREPFVDVEGLNRAYIKLQTPALPIDITFVGHFKNPLDWTHTADNPFLVNWNLELIVHYTNPSLETIFNQVRSTDFIERT